MTTPTPTVQVIDENKEFHSVSSYFDKVGLGNNGLDYHVVAVFGSQSTGKSTLLNALFGTKFQVMGDTSRSQTTKGIWMGRASSAVPSIAAFTPPPSGSSGDEDESGSDEFVKVPTSTSISPASSSLLSSSGSSKLLNILVLDVEGTDGRERGEDQDFERKSALFALATSEVLIVNMWENQVGLYQGANMGLLKTVFEVNLSLFGKNKMKSVLLFVIRDYLGVVPLDNLSNTIKADLRKQWSDIAKPPGLEDSRFEDYFDVQVCGLSHKVLQPEKFQYEVEALGNRFSNSHNKHDFIFNPSYHRNVPIDGWNMYAKSVWEQIEQNKDLDLPTQQILVARFRCEELLTHAWTEFETGLTKLGLDSEQFKSAPYLQFGDQVGKLRLACLELYSTIASRYHKQVYDEKKKELVSKLDSTVSILFRRQISLLTNQILTGFKSFKFDPQNGSGSLKKTKADALVTFDQVAKDSSLGLYDYSEERLNIIEQLDEQETRIKEQEIRRIVNRCNKKIAAAFQDHIGRYFVNPTKTSWDDVDKFFNETLDSVVAPYVKTGFNVGEEDVDKIVLDIRKNAWQNLDLRLRDIIREESVVQRLREYFEKKFRYDENKIPIVWKPSDDIEKPFTTSRVSAEELLPFFATTTKSDGELLIPDVALIDEDDDEDDYVAENFSSRLSPANQDIILDRFKQQADAVYVEAKRSVAQSATQIPLFVFAIIVVLGWNEFMAVLRSPFLFISALMLLGGAYAVHTLGMWGPLLKVTNAMFNETTTAVKEKLREVLEVPAKLEGSLSHKDGAGESIELDNLKPKTNQTDEQPVDTTAPKMPGSF